MSEYSQDEWQRLIEQYKNDMMATYSHPSVVPTQQSSVVQPEDNTNDDQVPSEFQTENHQENLNDIGSLQVRVSTENQAIPIIGAVVTVTHRENGKIYLTRTMITNENGLTDIIDLPTKDRSLSLVPGNPAPYAEYTVDVSADGYFPKRFLNLPIYGGVTAIQNVSMIPLPESGGDDIVLSYPQSGPENL